MPRTDIDTAIRTLKSVIKDLNTITNDGRLPISTEQDARQIVNLPITLPPQSPVVDGDYSYQKEAGDIVSWIQNANISLAQAKQKAQTLLNTLESM